MSDIATAVKHELFDRIAEIQRLWAGEQHAIEEAEQSVQARRKRQAELVTQYEECVIAARVFGFNLEAEHRKWLNRQAHHESLEPFIVRPAVSVTTSVDARPVREIILEAAERAYPNPVRASELKKAVAEQGRVVHSKTIGMTLYRLSQTGQMRRRTGTVDWYFIPKAQSARSAAPEQELEAETTNYDEADIEDLI